MVTGSVNTILVVDNDENILSLYEDYLRLYSDFNIIMAKNGMEAVTKFKESSPDLTFMDMHMPIMNGIDAFLMIKEFDKNANIVFLTNDPLNGELGELKKIHNVEIFTKTKFAAMLENLFVRAYTS
ncbi:response regulator [Nitrosopumilus sp. K4]|uniref:response regulator transcription factor n=1 Tax=Nitrosopumilus sp. K4 TaxID=2795383 RepID=UPI001BAC4B09|nr:response regulator [Nitrosopumilus sp. K4]QUC64863.1 response regulator [Nitrosopumilus sp. K4]